MKFKELKREIETGAIVSVSTLLGQRVAREELIAAAMRVYEQATIEKALGDDAAAVLPEVIRLVELRARVPREELAAAVPRLELALGWPASAPSAGY